MQAHTYTVSCYNTETGLVDKGRAVGNVYLDFTKNFDTVPCKTVLEKLIKGSQDKPIARWMKAVWMARPKGCGQRVVTSGTKTGWRLLTSGVPQESTLRTTLFNGQSVLSASWLMTQN